MEQHDRVEELRGRIRDSARLHGEPLPREMALARHGYLAAALEWGLIPVAQHEELSGVLPEPQAVPVGLAAGPARRLTISGHVGDRVRDTRPEGRAPTGSIVGARLRCTRSSRVLRSA